MADQLEYENKLDQWQNQLQPFIQSKLEEFQLLGLTHLNHEELWAFAKEKISKEKKKMNSERELRLYQIVSIVMSLSVNDYMNKIRLEMFNSEDLFSVTQEL